jgi:DNA-binding transcriptional regulator YiaG
MERNEEIAIAMVDRSTDRQMRDEIGLSPKDFAGRLDLSFISVSAWLK